MGSTSECARQHPCTIYKNGVDHFLLHLRKPQVHHDRHYPDDAVLSRPLGISTIARQTLPNDASLFASRRNPLSEDPPKSVLDDVL